VEKRDIHQTHLAPEKPGDLVLNIDASLGEGGGQILRTALACALCQGRPFHMFNIRAARKKPGMRPQHLAAVTAARALADAKVEGAEIDSRELTFCPGGKVKGGSFRLDIGTAGSTTLVAQTILPALLTAPGPSELILEGGTHNPQAPSFDFLSEAFLPLLNCMGPTVNAKLKRPGFYPAGGGLVRITIQPVTKLHSLDLERRGAILDIQAVAMLSRLPEHIGKRELKVIRNELDLDSDRLHLRRITTARGPGNVVSVLIRTEQVTEVFTGFGRRGVPAETVAAEVVKQVKRYLDARVPVGKHLADQLLLPLALVGKGCFVSLRPSRHSLTNMEILRQFLAVNFATQELGRDRWRIGLD
jgi:RNA 3'-terminal phosphate cyclase (ATP)